MKTETRVARAMDFDDLSEEPEPGQRSADGLEGAAGCAAVCAKKIAQGSWSPNYNPKILTLKNGLIRSDMSV